MERAHRICGACSLSREAVDGLIDTTSHSRLTRQELVKLWEQTYADPDELEDARSLCQPCVNAILAVAGESQDP